ncbi:MAG: hypothetical protein V3S89_15350 [Desulfobacterales bacterium]
MIVKQMMKRTISFLVGTVWFFSLTTGAFAQEERIGRIDWVNGYIIGHGIGFADANMNKRLAQTTSIRAAKVEALRNLLIMIKQIEIDPENPIQDFIAAEKDRIIRIDGLVKGARTVSSRTEQMDDSLLAIVEMRVCMSDFAKGCASEKSLVSALDLKPSRNTQPPPWEMPQEAGRAGRAAKVQPEDIPSRYDPTRPVTGVVFSLRGLPYKRVMLPVIAVKEGTVLKPVYSIRSVKPDVVRSYGIVRFADTLDQVKGIGKIGNNYMVVPAIAVTDKNILVISSKSAHRIDETTRHGNDYLETARVAISAE